MWMNYSRRVVLVAFAAALPSLAALAADTYPQKPVKLVVPMAAGGNGDIIARLIGKDLAQLLGQPVLVDNRPGAGGNIGADAVAKSPADGYTLVLGAVGTHAINASLYKRMPYDIRRDFTPITMMATVPNVLVVPAALPVKNVQELIAYGKKHPNGLNFGSSGAGSSIHLSGEMFKSMTGLQMTHVAYKGSAPAMTDLLAGQVDLVFDNLPTALPHIQSGKLRALAVTSTVRSPALPDVPTMEQAGVKGFEAGSWFGILAPAKTPQDVVNALDRDIQASLARPETRKALIDRGFQPATKGPREFTAFIDQEIDKWAVVVKKSGATAD
ncbi:tripartite tricarboxylate transporter substrate binding protein [Variovorax robiniae]|uniref:Tripartite tricarboxylate transporter substrate binding protein n=1 Tax=Variovorax robiniae TaxID=1836199 RepID=A0ABU8XD06_9BURK